MAAGLLNNIVSEIEHNRDQCQNLALRFNCYIPWEMSGSELKPSKEYLINSSVPDNVSELNILLSGKIKRHFNMLKLLKDSGMNVRYSTVHTVNRLIVGMGNPNPYENGMTFQCPLGYPIVPGSAQKGISALFARDVYGIDETGEDYIRVFGGRKKKGGVIFFDAIPKTADNILEADIMTPHYDEYYRSQGRIHPADYLSPNPIHFLTVRKGTAFIFSIASCDSGLSAHAWHWLKGGLSLLGAGGKTRVDYGRFMEADFDNYKTP
jgi:CRISPR-associated protein Cmr6